MSAASMLDYEPYLSESGLKPSRPRVETSRETHHTMFHFIYKDKDIGVSTKLSQGEREIGIALIKRMRA
jgi:hypothetical protein